MFIAHIPAAYILAKATMRKHLSWVSLGALSLGAIIPDFDLLRFYLLDNHQYHHHSYWTHRPAFWLVLFGIVLAIATLRKCKFKHKLLIYLFFTSTILHMVLDSILGEIAWLWPLTGQTWTPIIIQDTQSIWILNFLLHWTFAVEIAICLIALIVFIKQERRTHLKTISKRIK